MTTAAIKALNDKYIINTYGDRKIAIARGDGARLWDADGKEYLDFFAGIAVANLGHCHPAVTQAICEQAAKLLHVSNLYYMEPQVRLAEMLAQHSFADQWFFCNGGAEANEAAIKLARRYWAQKGTPRPEIITAENSFHGRTLTTITATGQPKYQQGFEPLTPGFRYVPYGDMAALEAAVRPETGAILLEPIQGEGGVRTADIEYWQAVREKCNKRDILLIFDEVQTGMGRTGKLFAHEHYGITPDIMTLAKALANGVPIGAMGCTAEVASGFSVGSHACTFGGNALSSAAALATLQVMLEPGFLDRVAETGAYFMDKLQALAAGNSRILEVRGKGLMIGVEMHEPVAPIVGNMIAGGVICGPAGPNVIRFVPPLIVGREEVDRVVALLDTVLKDTNE
jgi:predicted acetylornithine/succinylornithine family transaminase